MKEGTLKFTSDARAPGVFSPRGEENSSILLSTVSASRRHSLVDAGRSGLLQRLALFLILPLFAAVSQFGCRSADDQAIAAEAAKAKSTESSAPKSSWPKTMTIPAGTTFYVSLNAPLRTDANKPGDNFTARLNDHVRVDQITVLPSGSEVRGRLSVVEPPHRTTGKAQMTLVFDQVVDPAGKLHSLTTTPLVLVAEGDKISDEEKVAAGAVIGGVIGALSSSKQRAKGAAIGAAAGAAAGGAIALATKGQQISLPAGQQFAFDLNESIRLSVTQQTANR